MGEPVKVRLAGHTLDEIPIGFTGLRPGRSCTKELLANADATLATSIERLRIARLNGHAPPSSTLLIDKVALSSFDVVGESADVGCVRGSLNIG
jgi:FlaA1/EpsC-like NDP-sugar epimerase